ncbi:MAG: hypothetical protein WAT74_15695 [Flavobacteriales bacterium]
MNDIDVFGLIRPDVDAHTLGVSTVGKLLSDCGYRVHIGDAAVAAAVAEIGKINNISMLVAWIKAHGITRLGFSYRLDPANAALNFGRIFRQLPDHRMFKEQGGSLVRLYFAGLPPACARIAAEYGDKVPVFMGDETQVETLRKMGVPELRIPSDITGSAQYDEDRMAFARELVEADAYLLQQPVDHSGYTEYGTRVDTLQSRIKHKRARQGLPLMRVHVGPYSPNYAEARKEFIGWLHTLRDTRFLDIVSVGSSQLSQSDFGAEWGDRPNGGGVPINSVQDLEDIRSAASPMLVRTYSSTRNVPGMAEVYEKHLNMAWHALSLWWFNRLDGRGPNDLRTTLGEHLETLRVIARHNKPFEPNIPHHFAFRGGDDNSYVLSSYLAAITAKRLGVKQLVLQTMLNTPKYTWGIQDLAKARALLLLVRELEDKDFAVYHQPRAGLDYFSPDLQKAKAQLASVTCMMDDVEPANPQGPDIIHVVSYSEAVHLATPPIINESIQITLHALQAYRRAKKAGHMDDMLHHAEVEERTRELYRSVKETLRTLEKSIPDLHSAQGLYEVFRKGVFAVPYLWEGREELKAAIAWRTALVNGGVQVVDDQGKVLPAGERMKRIFAPSALA